jgi:phosphonate transport system substrate-binding protein
MKRRTFTRLVSAGLFALLVLCNAGLALAADGTKANPLRVMLIPADGGTESGTIADFKPLFNAVTRATGIHFDMRVGQSYGAVIEAISSDLVDVAWFGPVSYVQAHQRGAAELLGVSVSKGASVYYAGIFVPVDSPVKSLTDLKGKRVSFGDVNSSSSFTYQVAMMLAEGMDPARDLGAVRMTGSHANSIMALAEGQVDAACLAFDSYEKAVNQGHIDPKRFRVLVKSDPIPNPPLALNTKLPKMLKAQLKQAFGEVHKAPGVTPDMVRGYGGKKVDRYNTAFTEEEFAKPAATLAKVTDEVKAAMLRRTSER